MRQNIELEEKNREIENLVMMKDGYGKEYVQQLEA